MSTTKTIVRRNWDYINKNGDKVEFGKITQYRYNIEKEMNIVFTESGIIRVKRDRNSGFFYEV